MTKEMAQSDFQRLTPTAYFLFSIFYFLTVRILLPANSRFVSQSHRFERINLRTSGSG
jgi:hypothetical protein